MTEIFAIISQFIFFFIIFLTPFTPKVLNEFFSLERNSLKFFDAHALNIIFFIYFCLFFSFFNVDLEILFKIYLILAIILLLMNFNKLKDEIKKDDYFKFFIFFIVTISIFFSLAQNVKLEWDGFFWIEKALIFKNELNIAELKNTEPANYPHLGGYLWAFFWKNSILELEYFGRFFYVYFYVIAVIIIFNISVFNNRNLLVLISLIFILLTYEEYLLSGYQEYLIFSSLLISSRFIFLIDFNEFKKIRLLFLTIFILYLNCWFKDEGLVYFLIFSIPLILILKMQYQKKILFFLSLPILVYIKFILEDNLIGVSSFPGINILSENNFTIADINILIAKIPKIVYHILIAFIKHPIWLLILSSIFIFVLKNYKFEKKIKYFLICLILNFSFIFAIFLTFPNLDFMLRLALDRLLFQTSGLYLILIIILMNNLRLFKNNVN